MSPSCSCISNNKFEFTIDYRDDYILYTDRSEWVTAEGTTPDKEYEIVIRNDEANLEKTITVGIGITTPIHISTLQSSQECGVDGIYTFIVDSCGLKLERTEAILQSLHCAYTNLLLKVGNTDKDWDQLQDIFFQLEYIKAASRVGLTDQASEHFNTLTKIIKQLNCSC